jgi:hypothetical protein
VTVQATDPAGIASVVVKGVYDHDFSGGSTGTCSIAAGPTTEDTQPATGGPPVFAATLNLIPPGTLPPKCYQIGALVTNSCGNSNSAAVQFILASNGCFPYPYAKDVRRALAWSSDLGVEGGRLQVIVNGTSASYPEAGRAYGMAALVDGPNHVEATLVDGKGKAGLWRFEFLSSQAVAGSLRVVAGDVVTLGATSVTFRLGGNPGERIAFTFDKK